MKIICNKANPSLGGLIVAEYIKILTKIPLEISWGDETIVENVRCKTSNDVARAAAGLFCKQLYGLTPIEVTEVDHWLTLALGPLSSKADFNNGINILNKALGPVTYLANKRLTIADFIVYATLYTNKQWQDLLIKKSTAIHVVRWYTFIDSQEAVRNVLNSLTPEIRASLTVAEKNSRKSLEKSTVGNRAREGKFVELPGAEMGKVVVRFPPEASGYLHIGHAKAALLNQYYQEAFQGKLIMRFDDTNPAKENLHFEKVILEDVAMLDIKPDLFTHTSQYFDLMLEYCEKLLKEEKAYVDDTDAETMKLQREQRIESVNRSNSKEKNLLLWDEMKKGTEKGQQCCVRAKIDMQSANGCMRDPTIYRCKNEPHPRTGDKYKVYPTYDFACPIVDAIEGVTHTLRTMEYHDRDPQFYWFIDALDLRKPHIWEYSRLSMTNTVLSKRKLTWFVNEGLVDGWDDPRMPTVRGVLRRGMTVQGLKEFIIAQGSSRSVVFMEWDKIWAFNKKVIDPIAPRYTALDYKEPVTICVMNVKEECLTVPKHPKNPDVGTKEIWISPKILIDQADAECLKEGENATFINWGNLLITKINRQNGNIKGIEAEMNLDNKDYKKTVKLTWLADVERAPLVPTWCVYFDHIISKPVLGKDEDFKQYINHETRKEVQMLGDPELKKLKKGDIIQLQRRGYFKVDVAYRPASLHTCREQPVVLFAIPDGHTNENPLNIVSNTKKPENVEKVVQTPLPKTAEDLNSEIIKQGNIVRKLKEQKAAKGEIESAVKLLLALKSDYKNITNIEWKPDTIPPINVADLSTKIATQGAKVRKLKAEKVSKDVIDNEVKVLINLKADYKAATETEWVASTIPSMQKDEQPLISVDENNLSQKIAAQGDNVRDLKAKKAEKAIIDAEVKILLKLKADYKTMTGKDWKPGTAAQVPNVQNLTASSSLANGDVTNQESKLLSRIAVQGDKVRQLKAEKAEKTVLDSEIKKLLELKTDFKNLTGRDWKPGMKPDATSNSSVPVPSGGDKDQGAKKTSKEKANVAVKQKIVKEKKPVDVNVEEGVKKQTRLGLEAKKEENLSEWYSQVITKGEMIEYYDVSGCYIFRPWSFAIWDSIKDWFDAEIKKLGVQNCYFPIFVSKSVLEKEKTHIADFSPEVAWVTKSGDSDMAEPVAIRPTSETVMYPAYAKWIQSYRDLPIKLNQWNNVVRWEFKHPQPFIRTREFLWQEGHNAFASKEETDEDVKTMLDLYAEIYTDLLAIPVVKGRKTTKEKFAGGDYTLTVEAFVSASGRGIQGATSHHLGQNFSRIFDITYEDPETQEKKYVFQNSWGITTRTIGVMIMVHADNQGLVLPPRVASVQVVIVPCGITVGLAEEGRNALQGSCDILENELKNAGVKVNGDYRLNYSPGWKFNHWELKGVPIRVELGPKDIEKQQIIAVRRDTGEKLKLPRASAVEQLVQLLDNIQNNLYKKAYDDLNSHTILLTDWSQFSTNLDKKNIILAPFCGDSSCEDKIKADSTRDDSEAAEPGAPSSGAKALCIPLEQPTEIKPSDKCIHPECQRKPLNYTLFGRSY